MYYSIFEAIHEPDKGEVAEAYYKSLVPKVKQIRGFIQDTFYGSPHTAGKAVNIAKWKDEDAMSRWRNESNHLRAQHKGADIYQSYRLRLGGDLEGPDEQARHFVVLYHRATLDEIPEDDITSLLQPEAASGIRKYILGSSVYQGPRIVWVSAWQSQDAAENLMKMPPRQDGDEIIAVRVRRDYTKSDRGDAPSDSPGDKSKL